MSFWSLSDGSAVKPKTEYEAPQGGGDFDPIPHGTDVMGFIDQIGWGDKDGATPIEYRICIAKPDGFKNRKLFFKLWPMGDSPYFDTPEKKKNGIDKAKNFLVAMDGNTGGELFASDGKPSDEDLQRCLMNKMMVFKIGHMKPKEGADKDDKGINYLIGVSSKSKGVENVPAPAPKPSPVNDIDDDIPF